MKYLYLVFVTILVIALGVPNSSASLPCENPENAERCRELLAARLIELANTLLDKDPQQSIEYAPAIHRNKARMDLIDSPMPGGVKRQDVDHVFLRFGRRR